MDFEISEEPQVEAEWTEIIWYDEDGNHTEPVVVFTPLKTGPPLDQHWQRKILW